MNMTKMIKKPKPGVRREDDRTELPSVRGTTLPARDALAYAAALQILG